ncbi:hypothetical protein PAXRUDRAFT_178560, partial [Paxillus rubicundulus Ve08.2h10]
DSCDRQGRNDLQVNHWVVQMPHLVDAYLFYCEQDTSGDGLPLIEELPNEPVTPASIAKIELVDIFSRRSATLALCPNNLFPNETLIYHGCLGCSPVYPTISISIRTLAAFRQSHRTCPHFTIQAQCKALRHLHHVSALSTTLSI